VSVPALLPTSIPSPAQGVWHVGPVPLRAYALCIIAGVVVAIWLGERRWVARGGRPGTVSDMAVWAVPFGLVGARLYHVASSPEPYFGDGGDPVEALYVWQGGLGIWGAIAFGALGAYIACRRAGVRFPAMADAVAPGIVLAQAIGRWGNWFNQELFGKPLDAPWGLEIDPANRPPGYGEYATFHPTFLYESLWCVGVALAVLWADRRFRLGHGRSFALYVTLYTAGRAWIELLRIDDANELGPFRVNVWTSLVLFVAGLAYLIVVGRLRPGREDPVQADSDDTGASAGKDSHTLADAEPRSP
jgi:prolipoprotein diacylglyceryl transferase